MSELSRTNGGGGSVKTVWKYTLEILDTQTVRIPSLSNFENEHGLIWGQVLHVGQQNNIPTLWLMVDTDRPERNVEMRIVGTGQECPDPIDWDYIGTSVCDPFVWHIFAKLR